jgi:hypothetical protein
MDVVMVCSRYCPRILSGVTEKNIEQLRVVGVASEIRTEHLTNPLGVTDGEKATRYGVYLRICSIDRVLQPTRGGSSSFRFCHLLIRRNTCSTLQNATEENIDTE